MKQQIANSSGRTMVLDKIDSLSGNTIRCIFTTTPLDIGMRCIVYKLPAW